MKDSRLADPTVNLEEIILFAIKLGSIKNHTGMSASKKKNVMNIFEALTDCALSSKQGFSRQA